MIGIEPTTVAKAGAYMAQYLGLSWPRDREAIVSKINDYRDLLYTDPNLRLFDNVGECICVSSFPLGCSGASCDGSKTFQGFTLPEHLISVAAAWEAKRTLNLHSRWRESHYGLDQQERGERVSITETSTQLPTERVMLHSGKLKVFCSNSLDEGKIVTMDVVVEGGVSRRITFTLKFDTWMESADKVSQIKYVSLPEGRVGTVVLAEASDLRVLSIYEPWEDVPNYRLFRISSSCPSGHILLQGVQRFREVQFDHEMVEIGSRTVLRTAAEHLRYGIGTTEQADNVKGKAAYGDMIGAIRGLVQRSRGEAKHDPNPFAGRRTAPSNLLPGYLKK